MKKFIGILAFAVSIGLVSTANAQSKTKKAEEDVKRDATVAGDKTAEVASKGAARVRDKVYRDKVGPDGQTVYINGHSRYYWIDKKGHRRYAKKSELRDKM